MKIGFGYDSHRLSSGRALILGGTVIPSDKGCDGHSDADVLVHAVIDAIFGAEANGDIGRHFPDTDERYRGISSMILLEKAVETIHGKVGNLDCTILLQKPRLSPYIDDMRRQLANVLHVDMGCISIKAKTEEGADAVGRGDLAKAYAVILINDEKPTAP